MASSESQAVVQLLPVKRQKLTNFHKCIICQMDSNETLRKARDTSIQTLVAALELRRDEVYERLKSDFDSLATADVKWHSNCYEKWTSKENLRYMQRRRSAFSPTPAEESKIGTQSETSLTETSRVSRSQSTSTDWTMCLFCKKKTHRRVKEMTMVRTFQACETIVQAATAKGDEDMLRTTGAVSNDLVAAEARYHRACHASYISKANLQYAGFHEGRQETCYDTAFKQLAEDISADLNGGKAFDMTILLDRYNHFLRGQGVAVDSYTTQRLKLRLKKHFGDDIVFHKPYDLSKSELLYSSSISLQDVINSAYQCNTATATGVPRKQPTTAMDDCDRVSLLYRTAKLIKSEINECQGISVRPPNIMDLTLTKSKSVIPDSLDWLLRWVIAKPEKEDEDEFSAPECSNSSDERRVLMLAQDVVHCATHARTNMPKHVALGIAVRHMTRSKQLITMLSRMGHCDSYDDVEATDTSLAQEILAKSDIFGTVLPSNISPGVFVQVAADNNDMTEETLDGKRTTHATTVVLYQRGHFGPVPEPRVYSDQTKRKRTLESTGMCQSIREYSAYGKRPAVTSFSGKIQAEWFKCSESLHSAACKMDLAWALIRMTPMKLFEVELFATEKQKVPSWSGFNAVVHSCVPVRTNIGYCPMIDGSPTEFSTVYTVMKNVQSMMASLGQNDSVITFDLAIYVKAKEIQWRLQEEFEDMVIRIGGFHIATNYLAVLGKKYQMSGIEDLLIESGMYGSSTTSTLLKGKSYNRGVRAHKIVMEAMFRLQWRAFVKWHSRQEGSDVDEDAVMEQVTACQLALEEEKDVQNTMLRMCDAITTLESEFTRFQTEARGKSQLLAYWSDYVSMVQLLLQFIKADRTGNWILHLSATAAMTPHFFAMDRPNYARWLLVYLADMNQLPETHPAVNEEFMSGNHAISRSPQPFAQVWTDMALKQSINRDSKTNGGIIGISQRAGALERWFLTCHERAAITTAMKEMCAIQDSDRVGTHREAAPKRVERDESDVQKLLTVITSELMTDPFSLDNVDDGISSLINIATGIRMPPDAATRMVNSYQIGTAQMTTFVEQRLNTNEVTFWDSLPNLKIKTFATLSKKKTVKLTDEKVITLSADRELFGRLLITGKSRDINLRELLSYELSTVPLSLAHYDGSLRKTNKSVLIAELEKKVDVHPKLPQVTTSQMSTAHIVDAMALVQMTKSAGAANFGEMAFKYYSLVTAPLRRNGCQRVDVVFDRYSSLSIKAGEREKRGTSAALEVTIQGPATPIPKQWIKYIGNVENKVNLCAFLADTWCHMGVDTLLDGQHLVIGGGFKNPQKSVLVIRGHCEELVPLKSDHEEADTRILLHAKHASHYHNRIVIQSPDTDVAVLCTTHYRKLQCRELWFRTGIKDKARYIPIHSLAHKLGPELCNALLGFHALTGCDSNSALSGLGKKKGFNVLLDSKEHQTSLGQLGEEPELSNSTSEACEAFICAMYSTTKGAGRKVNNVRYWQFCQKGQRNENLPPTFDSLQQHMKRGNYQAYVWKRALEPTQSLPPAAGHGWKIQDGALQPVLMTKDPAPRGLPELTVCHCKKSLCRRADCTCRTNHMPCTEACACMAEETCENPRTIFESSGEEDAD